MGRRPQDPAKRTARHDARTEALPIGCRGGVLGYEQDVAGTPCAFDLYRKTTGFDIVLPSAVGEEKEVVTAGEVGGLLDVVVGITAVVIGRPVGVEFAILAGEGGGVDLDLLDFNEDAGKGDPAGDSRKGVAVVGTKGGGAEVAVLEEKLAGGGGGLAGAVSPGIAEGGR